MATLEPLELNAETEAQWAQLAAIALEHEQLAVAERSYAALGDIAKARYLYKVGCHANERTSYNILPHSCTSTCCTKHSVLRELNALPACVLQLRKAATKGNNTDGGAPAQLPASVRAQLALLSKQWPVAEALLLAQGQVDEAITAYQQAHRSVWLSSSGPEGFSAPRCSEVLSSGGCV